ncbi:NAD(P)H-binding protein [Corynebacterium sp. 319]|uniref:NAD(P)H-binding protein n=1 Tax=unclassified Corynebacterium TaxID=2624378 RepID=UPI00125CC41E|nr:MULTISPECIES: NAD(P)H-binding protein [unclassified Corynebacterium]KAB1551208.1 NAD(P)H-binding protein [Corynebacterium sp. 321]KAB1551964.1 NAD(P)H-binding protein [Corynebacterium sp. 319]KAB3538958.1 NAD(P)H-binding protein [Corynebacterium sp. 366]
MTTSTKKVLYIGGHGKIGLLSTKKLSAQGHKVHSLVRNPDYTADVNEVGGEVVLADITKLSVDEWADLLTSFDDVVWGAGNGGRGGADVTWAVDRDGALATIEALEKLQSEGRHVPRYFMISYLGATTNTAEESSESWYAYVESKKAVDLRLAETSLPYFILGPATLTDEDAAGITVLPQPLNKDTLPEESQVKTSRELVADVVTELVGRDEFPSQSPLEFIDGEDAVSSI